jgi:hypothetical protein
LYGEGPEQAPRLYALTEDGNDERLELGVYQGAAVSATGRWVASPSSYPTAASVAIANLGNGRSYAIDATEDWGVYEMVFDRAEQRLAFLELAPAPVPNIPWAIVVVDLADGSTTRFEGMTRPEQGAYPGNPLGWTPDGRELLIGTFLPYSDGPFAGVRALVIPPGTASAPIDELEQRTLIPGGAYRSVPHPSPDGTRLLYLARDPDYMPADYEPALDFAVNQLWTLEIASATSTMLLEVTDGDALGADAAWAPDGERILFARGHYDGVNWGTLALRVRDGTGKVTELASLPMPEEGAGLNVNWCRADTALGVLRAGLVPSELHWVDVASGELKQLASADAVFVLGCIQMP